MTNEKNRNIKRVWQEIHDVLIKIWDPIGVSDVEAAQDEYDSYIGGIYSLLEKGADAKTLEDHLLLIETKQMGLSKGIGTRSAVVEALLNINYK
jgi:hypothetical protein